MRKYLGIPENAIVFLNVNRNTERKRLDLTIMAFVELIAAHNNPLYLVLTAPNGYYNVLDIFQNEIRRKGLDLSTFMQRLVCVSTAPPAVSDDTAILGLYGACDVGINTSNGEGFGLGSLEHLACGSPQVVVDSGDYRSFLTDEVAVILPPTIVGYLPGSTTIGRITASARVSDIAEGMQKAILLSREKCVAHAKQFSWAQMTDSFLERVIGK